MWIREDKNDVSLYLFIHFSISLPKLFWFTGTQNSLLTSYSLKTPGLCFHFDDAMATLSFSCPSRLISFPFCIFKLANSSLEHFSLWFPIVNLITFRFSSCYPNSERPPAFPCWSKAACVVTLYPTLWFDILQNHFRIYNYFDHQLPFHFLFPPLSLYF